MEQGRQRRRVLAVVLAGVMTWPAAGWAQGQQPQQTQPPKVLTLDDALAMAEQSSDQIAIAQAGVNRADSNEMRAKADQLPQVNVSGSYDRALQSEFADVFGTGPSCTPLTVNPSAPLDARVTEIERALQECPPSLFSGSSTSNSTSSNSDSSLPFGQRNTYRVNLQISQSVFTAGRVTAQRQQARFNRVNASLNLNSTRAQLELDVAQAYYEAALNDRLVAIAEATLTQAQSALDVTKAQRDVGRVSEFDLLRAQVSRNTQQPEVIRRRNARELAYLRFKQLLNLPLDQPIQLTVNLSEDTLPVPAQRFATAIAEVEAAQPPSAAAPAAPTVAAAAVPPMRERVAITEGQNQVRASEAAVKIARAERFPTVALNTQYGRVAYPAGLPSFGDFRTNWTVGASVQWAAFDGGRLKAGELSARADLAENQARLHLTRELATLDEASARNDLDAARAAWDASGGTVEQARKAYEIAELRYKEGISTQLELNDTRLQLQQAEANRAQAARDLQVARVKLALLPDLPLTTTGASTPTQPQQVPQAQQPVAQPQQQPAATGQQTGATGVTTTGITGASTQTTGGRP